MSQPRGNSEYLKDIEIAATEAIEFVEGMDSGDFTGDRKTIAAVVQKITVIGGSGLRDSWRHRAIGPRDSVARHDRYAE